MTITEGGFVSDPKKTVNKDLHAVIQVLDDAFD